VLWKCKCTGNKGKGPMILKECESCGLPATAGLPDILHLFPLRERYRPIWIMAVCLAFSSTALSALVACDINRDGRVSAVDVQLAINGALAYGAGSPKADVDLNGSINAVDVQLVINAALALDVDIDDDGLCDSAELNIGTDPNDSDSDDDRLNDGDETEMGTDPSDPDSDGDELDDGDEIEIGTDPADPDR